MSDKSLRLLPGFQKLRIRRQLWLLSGLSVFSLGALALHNFIEWEIFGFSHEMLELLLTALASCAIILLSWRVDLGIGRPLERLFAASDRWSQGEFGYRASLREGGEIGALGERLNRMAARLEQAGAERSAAERALRRAEERYRNFIAHSGEAIYRFALPDPIRLDLPYDEMVQRVLEMALLAESNLAHARLYGLANELETGGLPLEVFGGREAKQHLIGEFVRNGFRLDGIEWSETLRGEQLWFCGSLVGTQENGLLTGAWGTQTDISDRKRAEEALKLAKERLELSLEGGEVSIWDTDMRTRQVWLSEGWAALIGDAPGPTQIALEDLMALVHPDDLEQSARLSMETIKGQREFYAEEHRVRARSGEWRWVASRGKVTERDAKGRALRMSGTNLDLTDRRRAEEALRESEERFRSLTGMASDFYWETDIEHRIVQRSAGHGDSALSVLAHGSPIGRRRWELSYLSPDESGWEAHRAVLDAHRPFRNFEFSRQGIDGGELYYSIGGDPMFDASGAFRGYRGVGANVTDRKQAQTALAEAKQRLEIALEGSSTAIWESNLLTRQMYLSSGWAAMIGGEPGETHASFDEMERIVHVDDMPGIAAATLAVLRGDSTGYSIEHRVRARSGDWRWISSRGQVIERDADGRALRMSGVNFDITARKWIEHSLQDSEEQLRIALAAADMSAWRWDIATGRFNWPMAPHALLGSSVESNFPDFRELVHSQDRAGFRKAWDDALEGAGDFSTEFRIVRTDGEERWVNGRGRLHRYETGAPDHLFGVIWDVTDRHRAYDALEQSEARFRDLVDLSSDWYWEQDAENRFRDISTGSRARAPQREGVLGLTRLEIPGSLMSDQMRAEHERVYAAREPFKEMQYPMRLPDGTVQHISVSGKPIYDGVGTFVGYRGVGRDVSAWMRAAQSVHDSREQLLRVIDTMFEGVVVYDAEGRIILINRSAERVLGVTRDQAIGLNINAVPWRRLDISGGSFDPTRLAWTMLRDTAMPPVVTAQHIIVAADGTRSTIQRNAARLTHQDGTFGGVVITFEDITNRLRADERSQMLIEASLDGYCAMNALGEVEAANRALEWMAGREGDTLTGKTFADIWVPAERDGALRAIEQAVAQGNARFAGRIARGDGAICDAEAGITYVDIEGGRMHAFFRDVTERNVATRRVEESERIYRTLFQHSPVGIAFVDTDGIIRDASASLARMAGVEGPQQLIGTRADDWVVPEERPDARRRRQMAIAGDNLLPFVERCLVRSDGTRMLTEMVAAPISVEGRQMAVVIGRDISERKKYEWTLLAAKDALEARVAVRTQELTEANRELEAFVYTVSHDLRAPLRFIGGHARLLHEHLGQPVTPRAAELLGGIESGAERLSMLIEGLLEFSRLGRQPLNRRKVELRSLVEEVLAAAAPASGRCEVCVGELPAAMVDPVLIKQVFANLVSNAFKYTSRRRSPRIEIGCETQQGQAVLFVRDNGVGFSIRYVDKAFEAFQRLHPESRFPGVGVGLAIVKRIVERHGGRVWAEAKVGKGATFRFTLGLADAGEP